MQSLSCMLTSLVIMPFYKKYKLLKQWKHIYGP